MPGNSYTPGSIPGVLEMRQLARKLYGVRIAGGLTYKLKRVDRLSRAGTGSSLFAFCLPDDSEDTIESAQQEFLKIVTTAGLGGYFGVREDSSVH